MNKVALVVDDTSYIREDIKDILEEQGYKVFEAGDGLEAVEMYKKVNPAIVTMDINMPRSTPNRGVCKLSNVQASSQKALRGKSMRLSVLPFAVRRSAFR